MEVSSLEAPGMVVLELEVFSSEKVELKVSRSEALELKAHISNVLRLFITKRFYVGSVELKEAELQYICYTIEYMFSWISVGISVQLGERWITDGGFRFLPRSILKLLRGAVTAS